MTAYLDDGDVQLYHGDVIETLRSLPAGVAQTCVTSPPYWGLRDYGTGEWTGGDADCDHASAAPSRDSDEDVQRRKAKYQAEGQSTGQHGGWESRATRADGKDTCRCGARRSDSQLGLEATPDLYVERMVAVFREVWRVLADTGTVWCNLGDSFLLGKQLAGIPWRVAFALQADGWYLRSDIIWSKPNPMPESVTDRPTKAHEYLFLLSKQPRYFYDADAIREPHSEKTWFYKDVGLTKAAQVGSAGNRNGKDGSTLGVEAGVNPAGRNRRSVWTIPTEPFPEAHFATYPQALVRPCVLAGTSERGECSACGAPWMRETSVEYDHVNYTAPREHSSYVASGGAVANKRVETTGWRASCDCLNIGATASSGREILPPTRPQTVLDPFIGSGTTALVARNHGRRCIGIDLSSDYLAIAARRLQQLSLLSEPTS